MLNLSNYNIEKDLEHATGVDISNLAAKQDFVALEGKVDRLDIAELVNVLTGLNNVKTKIDYLDVGELKTVTTNFKTLVMQ